jgi:diguanylate cyclase (GGDEF)-like protein/PAS domain S-box-containing protein
MGPRLPEEAFRLIIERSAHPFVVITVDGTVRFASASISEVLGWKAEDVVGRSMADFMAPEDLETAADAIAEIDSFDRTGAGVPMVFGLRHADGSIRWVEIGAMPLLEVPGVEAIALRLRVFDAQKRFDDFVDRLLAGHPLEDVLMALSRSIAAALDAQGAVIHHGFDGSAFNGAAGFGLPIDVLPLDRGPWLEVVRTGEPCHRSVSQLDPEVIVAAGDLRACFAVPVVAAGVAPAALSVWRTTPGPPLIGHRHVLERSARYVELALVRTAEHQRLRHLAGHDALTGVANRAEFRNRLAHALAIGERDIAVAFLDLDGFKPVNDTWGHRAGDQVLVEVASRLRLHVRTGDELARVGGDEFTVLLRNVPDTNAAAEVAQRLLGAFEEPFKVGDAAVQLGVSIGIALSSDRISAEGLLERADEALYEVKRAGGGSLHVADDT